MIKNKKKLEIQKNKKEQKEQIKQKMKVKKQIQKMLNSNKNGLIYKKKMNVKNLIN